MKTNSTIKLTQTETSKTVEFSIPNEEAENVTAGILKKNHLRGLYADYCILNQEFLKYITSLKLKPAEYRILFLVMSEMDKENKVLLNNDLFMKKLKSIEVKFNIVNGWFDCSNNYLLSLVGCPEIAEGGFSCNNNELTSLKGCPKIVKNNYINLKENKELGELQNINYFNDLKKILTIYQEKNKLDLLINKDIDNEYLESTDFINKVGKINKI